MKKNIILFDLLKEHKWEEFSIILKDDLNNDINVNIRDNSNNYLIQYAIIFNKKEIVSLLINKGAKLDVVDTDGRCLLHYPIKYKYTGILELLLHFNSTNIGISLVDIRDREGHTPLHYCIIFDDLVSSQMLLKNNADPNIKNKDGFNCLHLAVYKKNVEMVKILLKTNININANTISGETALHFACNFENYEIVELLLGKGADPNVQNFEHEISPLVYCITLRNKKILNLLLEHGADINTQDYYGNTPLHFVISEDDIESFDYIFEKKPNVNIYNAESKLPLHIALEKFGRKTEHYIKKLLEKSDINLQNNIGNTSMHLLVATNFWINIKDMLIKKSIDIFLKNTSNMTVLQYVKKEEKSDFIDMVCKSFLYQLKNEKSVWALEWEKVCSKDKLETKDIELLKKEIKGIKGNIGKDLCYQVTRNFIETKNISIPIKKIKEIDVYVDGGKCVQFTTFTGVTLDVLIGLIYLSQKHKYMCPLLSENFENNPLLEKYYNSLGLENNSTTEYLNFEIVWVYQKLFFPIEFDEKIKKCISKENIKFIVVPIGIELSNGSHANYIIYDLIKKEVERFEPNGSYNPHKFNYNPDLLDILLEKKFKKINNKINYIRPKDYLPKVGFQLLDAMENRKFKRIGDPGGFCAAWTVWYVDMRLSNQNVSRDQLIKEIIKKIKRFNYSFKNIIRNYTSKITNLRDDILKKSNLEINDWLNKQFSYNQVIQVNDEIRKLIKDIDKPSMKRTTKLNNKSGEINWNIY